MEERPSSGQEDIVMLFPWQIRQETRWGGEKCPDK